MKNTDLHGEIIYIYGIVQGVGFRPHVWHKANQYGIIGYVCNDNDGVLIYAWGTVSKLDVFVKSIIKDPPKLARIHSYQRILNKDTFFGGKFEIRASKEGWVSTWVLADVASCSECLADVDSIDSRHYRYPFTNCTHCGPRLSIIKSIPYDRGNTSMSSFVMCPLCSLEYSDPKNRRFHAQPNACPNCGPQLKLYDNKFCLLADKYDAIEKYCSLINSGKIIALKSIGGFHLSCDATDKTTLNRLRERKNRNHKPFALMAKDMEMINKFAYISDFEAILLKSRAAPIVILDARYNELPEVVAPRQNTLGFFLPYTPLHHIIMRQLKTPLIMTSGNNSGESQYIDNKIAMEKLNGIADYFLVHDRDIINRLDDSIVRVIAGKKRFLRRARGYAPEPINLPSDFNDSANILAMGGESKNCFCLIKNGQAIISQFIGDIENVSAMLDYHKQLNLYKKLYNHEADIIAIDKHPNYLSSQLGRQFAQTDKKLLEECQHHHAHITSCMAEHGLGINSDKVLGVVMDGLGYGENGDFWGGEFILADYKSFTRLASLEAVPMLGGSKAILEPWRNAFANFAYVLNWPDIVEQFSDLDIIEYLKNKPLKNLNIMLSKRINSPLSSSCGRLFDAVAATLGICRDKISYEGQAAIELETLAKKAWKQQLGQEYPYSIDYSLELPVINTQKLWIGLLIDLQNSVEHSVIAARFHHTIAKIIFELSKKLCEQHNVATLVVSGGVFQNKILLEEVVNRLSGLSISLLIPEKLPINDGGLAFGQAMIAAARNH